jgi:hypothetical protein
MDTELQVHLFCVQYLRTRHGACYDLLLEPCVLHECSNLLSFASIIPWHLPCFLFLFVSPKLPHRTLLIRKTNQDYQGSLRRVGDSADTGS